MLNISNITRLEGFIAMKKLIPALFVLLLSFPAHAEVERYTFDNPHTQIVFMANHLGFSRSVGKFTDYDGSFVFDRGHPEKSHVEITIKTGSIDLESEKWNAHMRGDDFFSAEKFPEMTFKSTDIKVLSDNTADITGDLTLLGVTKPITLHTKHNKSAIHPFSNKYVSGFSAQATLKRSEFGMTYGLPAIGDDIDIIIEVEGIREESSSNEQVIP